MLITRIIEQVKNPNRVSVFVDGRYCFSLNLDQLLETKLKIGQELNEAELKVLQKLSSDGKLKMRTLEWLMIRPRSERELCDYLKRKKVEPELMNNWLNDFKAKNYQNDKSFARWWVSQRRAKGRSAASITFELRTKGVSSENIQTALEETETNDQEALADLIIKKRRNARYQDDKKLTEYLMRKGFKYSVIIESLKDIKA